MLMGALSHHAHVRYTGCDLRRAVPAACIPECLRWDCVASAGGQEDRFVSHTLRTTANSMISRGVPGSLVGRGPTVHLAIHSSQLVKSDAARLLGGDHPLTRALAERAAVRSQLWLISALDAGSWGAHALGVYPAAPIAIAAGVVWLVWCCRAALAEVRTHDVALETIAAGGARLPLDVVARERERLLDGERRRRLARWLETVGGGRDLGFGQGCTRPLLSAPVMRAVRRELEDVAAQVDGEAPSVAGLALLERLVRNGASPLYGEDATALRQELWRIRWRLCG
jgi:hypothetical protein